MDVCLRLFCVCVVLCRYRPCDGWSPVQGVLPTVYKIMKLTWNEVPEGSTREKMNEDGGDVPPKRRLTLNGLYGLYRRRYNSSKYTTFRKLDPFPTSGVRTEEDPFPLPPFTWWRKGYTFRNVVHFKYILHHGQSSTKYYTMNRILS
jgi:hypothetical protein